MRHVLGIFTLLALLGIGLNVGAELAPVTYVNPAQGLPPLPVVQPNTPQQPAMGQSDTIEQAQHMQQAQAYRSPPYQENPQKVNEQLLPVSQVSAPQVELSSSPIEARLMVKIEDLKAQQLTLMGKLEVIENLLFRLHKQQGQVAQSAATVSPPAGTPGTSMSTDSESSSVVQPVKGGGAPDGGTPPADVPASPDEILLVELKHLQPEQAYDKARSLIPRGEYALAERALGAFIKQHEKHPLVPAALYWIGETHFVKGDYTTAAKKFLEGYKVDPKSVKVPDLLLKMAMSLAHLGKTNEACASYKKLFHDYPNMNSSIKAVATREKARLQCKD